MEKQKKLTKNRQLILQLLQNNQAPVNAKIIHQKLSQNDNTQQINLSTVYRSLDYLEINDFIKSFAIAEAKYYYAATQGKHGHFLICKQCQEIIPFTQCNITEIQSEIEKKFRYSIQSHLIIFEGHCLECDRYIHKKKTISQKRL